MAVSRTPIDMGPRQLVSISMGQGAVIFPLKPLKFIDFSM